MLEAFATFFQVLMIDLVLAGDNAVAVGLAAGGLAADQRRKVILLGLSAAVALRIGFALITTQLLGVIGLLFGGGLLLLWVCWKMYRDLSVQPAEHALAGGPPAQIAGGPAPKTLKSAFLTILAADDSMSLDNVLAVAGAAREHPVVLAFGLILSVALMGLAANWIATLLQRHRWIGYVGLLIVLYVALHMMWEGHRDVVLSLGQAEAYNAIMPNFLDLKPGTLQPIGSEG
jgi:YjbE family integral membrane protein